MSTIRFLERPILFSGPMVRALLAGTKTQTRRRVKDRRIEWTAGEGDDRNDPRNYGFEMDCGDWAKLKASTDRRDGEEQIPCPYGQPGDRLWVREQVIDIDGRAYYADDLRVVYNSGKPAVWLWRVRSLSPRYLPRWASRLSLAITDVRVQRLQELSEDDAIAEGVQRNVHGDGSWSPEDGWIDYAGDDECHPAQSARESFSTLWESIYGPGSWGANPWVWAVTFQQTDQTQEKSDEIRRMRIPRAARRREVRTTKDTP